MTMFTLVTPVSWLARAVASSRWDTKAEESSTKIGISVVGLPGTRKKGKTSGSKLRHN